ncbi:unnamed protein product [Didymodactylos carnosus]|uniref:Uncharacterized protein n=1 Tax=Didymodactylos carnosus TaxID=1234261 RepID=A0A814EX15_9BILA|nr:unnamed protein product [Didymodactylos carnosus]CAF3746205.1 unnamed protein product [Didymodactylos carnosus]
MFILVLDQKKEQLRQLKQELADCQTNGYNGNFAHSDGEDENSRGSGFADDDQSNDGGGSNLLKNAKIDHYKLKPETDEEDEDGMIVQPPTPERITHESVIIRKPVSHDDDEDALDLGTKDGSDIQQSTQTKHITRGRRLGTSQTTTLNGRLFSSNTLARAIE